MTITVTIMFSGKVRKRNNDSDINIMISIKITAIFVVECLLITLIFSGDGFNGVYYLLITRTTA